MKKMDTAGFALDGAARECAVNRAPMSNSMAMKARQSQRIRDIRQTLIDAGFVSLDQQAEALGLSRSTTWAVLKGSHKGSGLRAALIARMFASPDLPQATRTILMNYVNEKLQGAYGHSDVQRERFGSQLQRFGRMSSDAGSDSIALNSRSRD
jgi:hypothetical protein